MHQEVEYKRIPQELSLLCPCYHRYLLKKMNLGDPERCGLAGADGETKTALCL